MILVIKGFNFNTLLTHCILYISSPNKNIERRFPLCLYHLKLYFVKIKWSNFFAYSWIFTCPLHPPTSAGFCKINSDMAPDVYLEIYAAVKYLKLFFGSHLPASVFLKQLSPSSEKNQGESHLIVPLTSPTHITATNKDPDNHEFILTKFWQWSLGRFLLLSWGGLYLARNSLRKKYIHSLK